VESEAGAEHLTSRRANPKAVQDVCAVALAANFTIRDRQFPRGQNPTGCQLSFFNDQKSGLTELLGVLVRHLVFI
jgi:hypothetical protein